MHSIMQCMMTDNTQQEAYEKIAQEMRRGTVVLATLSRLETEKYGYALISQLAEHDLPVDQGTLYPLLRRLEAQGLLDSTWNTDGARPRRYYRLNDTGRAVLAALRQEWQALSAALDNLLALGAEPGEQSAENLQGEN